jgi:hypothetical protein
VPAVTCRPGGEAVRGAGLCECGLVLHAGQDEWAYISVAPITMGFEFFVVRFFVIIEVMHLP